MKTLPDTRNLARCLTAYEAGAAESSEPANAATLRVYEKLRQSLSVFAGVAAFESLAFRALTQAKSEAPSLWAVEVADDGTLRVLDESEPQIETDMVRPGMDLPDEAGTILIARLLGLLLIFLGEALTLSLLQVTWPGAALNESNSDNGRNG